MVGPKARTKTLPVPAVAHFPMIYLPTKQRCFFQLYHVPHSQCCSLLEELRKLTHLFRVVIGIEVTFFSFSEVRHEVALYYWLTLPGSCTCSTKGVFVCA